MHFLDCIIVLLPFNVVGALHPNLDISTRDVASITDFHWTISNFSYHGSYIFSTPAHQNSWGYLNFNVTNSAVGSTSSCSASSDQLEDFFYGTFNYTCVFPDGNLTFNYNQPARVLGISNSWKCGDGHTYYAEASATLGPVCTGSSWTNPNWTIGEIYSTRDVFCTQDSGVIKPVTLPAIS